MKLLVKLGGSLLDCAGSRERLAREIAATAGECQLTVVHGGGRQMTRYLAERGIESRFVNGQRVTTAEVLDAVLKIFAGTVNAEMVSTLRAAGARPVGLTGLDAGLVDAAPLDPSLGHVGMPTQSDPRILEVLVGAGYLPVVACIAGDAHGRIYNVNGDRMAAACAAAFGAETLIFLTDVDGVHGGDGTVLPELDASRARDLICSGVASGGMQAKLEAAVWALEHGVGEVRIAPGSYNNILESLIADRHIGTRIVQKQ